MFFVGAKFDRYQMYRLDASHHMRRRNRAYGICHVMRSFLQMTSHFSILLCVTHHH